MGRRNFTKAWAKSLVGRLPIIFGAFIFVGFGPVRRDISSNPKHSSLIGTELRTKTDLVITRYSDSKKLVLGLFGRDAPEKDAMKSKFPFKYEGNKILGVLPAGSLLRLSKVTEEGAPGALFVMYYATLQSSADEKFLGKEFSISLIYPDQSPPVVESVSKNGTKLEHD